MSTLKVKNLSSFWIALFSILASGFSTTTTTTETCFSATEFPKSCSDFQYESGSTENSSQLQSCLIYPNGPDGNSLEVLCDFEVDGGGWTVIQKRGSGSREEFNQTWDAYVAGFGALDGNFWIGLESIRALTENGDQELRIELEDFDGNKAYAKYSSFSISDASDFYRLSVEGFSGDAGDSLVNTTSPGHPHNGMQFSTKDKDNDNMSGNCAEGYSGGWWFNTCFLVNLNGVYRDKGEFVSYAIGIHWYSWTGYYNSLAKTEMKIRTRKSP